MQTKKVGLILPSPNIHMEPQYYRIGLPDVEFFATKVMLKETTEEALVHMQEDLDYASQMMATIHPDVVCYCCTSGSFIRGDEFDRKIMQTIEQNCSCPGLTTSFAMSGAMQEMGIHRAALITPYTDDINKQEIRYMESKGIAVPYAFGFQCIQNEPLVSITEQQWVDETRKADLSKCDAVFLSCTNTKAMPVAEQLEHEIGKPVLTSNSVTLWDILRTIHYKHPVMGYGMLLSEHLIH